MWASRVAHASHIEDVEVLDLGSSKREFAQPDMLAMLEQWHAMVADQAVAFAVEVPHARP